MSFLKNGINLKALLENPALLEQAYSLKCKEKAGKPVGKDVAAPFQGQSAFLGQQLWDKTLPYDVTGDLTDLKLEYMDLDEFITENCIPTSDELNQFVEALEKSQALTPSHRNHMTHSTHPSNVQHTSHASHAIHAGHVSPGVVTSPVNPEGPLMSSTLEGSRSPISAPTASPGHPLHSPASSHGYRSPSVSCNSGLPQGYPSSVESLPGSAGSSPKIEVNYDVNPSDLELACIPGDDSFDPRKKTFSEEELRPQPIIKKSRKVLVPDECKDDKYWNRRKKNNVAAKRSREARRIKENQITLRAAYLEKENDTLRREMKKIKEENKQLKKRLEVYEK